MDKNALRHELRKKLVQTSIDDRIAKSKQICRQIIDSETFQKASVVMMFLSLPSDDLIFSVVA